jgi:hypothetical protein
MYNVTYNGCFLKFGVEVGVVESIANAQPNYNSDQLLKSNLTFCGVCVVNLQFEKSVFLRRLVHSQSTLQRQLRRQILKNTLYLQPKTVSFRFFRQILLKFFIFIKIFPSKQMTMNFEKQNISYRIKIKHQTNFPVNSFYPKICV